jgi:hypothetical protein
LIANIDAFYSFHSYGCHEILPPKNGPRNVL